MKTQNRVKHRIVVTSDDHNDQINFGKWGIVCLLGPRGSADQKGSSDFSKTGLVDRFHLKFQVGSFGQAVLPRAGILGRNFMYIIIPNWPDSIGAQSRIGAVRRIAAD
jgi:hypothetical protein